MSPRARALMRQGTASHVGKTFLAAPVCRVLRDAGWLEDRDGLEGGGPAAGLGCLPVRTRLAAGRITRQARARLTAESSGFPADEIRPGRSTTPPDAAPRALVVEAGALRPDGMVAPGGGARGTSLHGFVDADGVRAAQVCEGGAPPPGPDGGADHRAVREAEYARVAAIVAAHLDVAALLRLVQDKPP